MKASLRPGISTTRRITIDEGRTIDFSGRNGRIYATPELLRDIERTCRDLLREYLDAGEDSVGAWVELAHLAPTLLGMWVDISVSVSSIDGRMVGFDVTAFDGLEQVARGCHRRFVADTEKSRTRLAVKARKADLAAFRV